MILMSWQYLRLELPLNNALDQNLRALGQEGWELVAVVPNKDGPQSTYYFKRPAGDIER
jgi:hypothetical protein